VDLGNGRAAANLRCKCYKYDKGNAEWVLLGDT
jgi:hypothetical protein